MHAHMRGLYAAWAWHVRLCAGVDVLGYEAGALEAAREACLAALQQLEDRDAARKAVAKVGTSWHAYMHACMWCYRQGPCLNPGPGPGPFSFKKAGSYMVAAEPAACVGWLAGSCQFMLSPQNACHHPVVLHASYNHWLCAPHLSLETLAVRHVRHNRGLKTKLGSL